MKFPAVKQEYIKIQGGLDLTSPAMSISPGRATLAMNYEAGDTGGLRRIDGYERFDGRPAPSDAVYYYLNVSLTGSVSVGDTVTGAAASGKCIIVASGVLYLTKVTGTFVTGETLSVGAPVGTLTNILINGAPTAYLNAVALNAAADLYRADIAKPTGSGAVLGGGELNGATYVFRNNAGGTAANLWKSTSSGWTQITLFNEISFNTGVGLISEGQTITQLVSGATALVKRVVLESGAWGADAAGRLIISNITGTFNAVNALQVGAVTKATATSLATAITILPGGKYETTNYNFYGSTATYRMYGCDGVNRGFEFDGTIYVPISTGMTTDTPLHIAIHKQQLFFTFNASLQNSGVGTPYDWTPVLGADERGMGDEITGLSVLVGDALGVFSERSIAQILGDTVVNFVQDSISPEVGSVEYAVQRLGANTLIIGTPGIMRIASSQDYGNFSSDTVSRDAQPIVETIRSLVKGSAVYRNRNQYRIYGSDGTGICVTAGTARQGQDYVPAFFITAFKYPISINCVFAGPENVYLCDTTGMVYKADRGSSFDGEDIEAYIRLAFNHSKSPTTIKEYLKAVIEISTERYSAIRFHPTFTYGDAAVSQHAISTEEITGLGGTLGVDTWSEFYYDARVVSSATFPVTGSGENISITAYSKSDIDLGHKIDGVVFHYIPRRLSR